MLTEKNAWQYFLSKMTALTAKGWVLVLDLSKAEVAISEQKKELLSELLKEQHQSKALTFFDNDTSSQFFLYFSEESKDRIYALLIKIQFLLGLSFQINQNNENGFYAIYHLPEDKEKLQEKFLNKELVNTQPVIKKTEVIKTEQVLSPSWIGKIEKSLFQADISSLMRHQSVCAIVGKNRPVELFEETYVPLGDLQKALCPDADIFESAWLQDSLFEVLDKRVLDNLSHHDSGGFRKDFSLNISVNTLLTPDFERFNKSLNDNLKSSILLEVRLGDVLNNPSVFLAARSYVLSEGFRLCIDCVTADTLPFVDKKKLGASFIKLQWDESLLSQSENKTFLNALKANDPNSVILYHIDDARAIKWGNNLGINIFQGYYVQKLLYQIPRLKKN